MAKQITDEEYNQVSEMYDKFIADPNQDPAKVAKVQDLWSQVQEEYKAQKASEPKINDAWGNQDGTSTFSYDNGTTNRFDQQGNKLSIDDMYQNNDGTVTTVYNNGSREITDQGGNSITKTNEQLAREVLQGKRGNGQARKNALANAGYDYNAVQRIVNNSVRRPRQVPPKKEELPPINLDFHAPENTQFWQKLGRLTGQDAINRWIDKQDLQYVQSQGGFFRDDGTGNLKAYDRDWKEITFFPW